MSHKNHINKRDAYPAQYDAVRQESRVWNQKLNLEVFELRMKTVTSVEQIKA
jgi:hypothetical protein